MPCSSPRKPDSPDEFEDFSPPARGRLAAAHASAAILIFALLVLVGWRWSIRSVGNTSVSVVAPSESVPAGVPDQDAVVVKKLNLTVVDDGRGGALVREVGPARFGAGAQWLSSGDRVVAFNTHFVTSSEDLAARVDAASGRTTIDVVEDKTDKKRTLVVLLPERGLKATTVEIVMDRK